MPTANTDTSLGKHPRECTTMNSVNLSAVSISESSLTSINSKRLEPVFIEDNLNISLDHYFVPVHYKSSLDCLLVPHGMILSRVDKLAMDIIQDYKGQTIHLLCVLKGGSTFFHDLCKSITRFHECSGKHHIPYYFDFIRVSSYSGTTSTGEVRITGCDLEKLKGKHVLFIEDIIDTGLTMTKIFEFMKAQIIPASINVVSLCEKRTPHSCGFKAKYVGFSIPDKFIVGYCMDYNEVYRDLNHIAVIGAAGIEQYKEES
jgi:hypoxanthine phosphoribosyltransferase